MQLFDAHTHVQFSAYDADRDAVIKRALAAGVRMVNVGTQRDTSASAVALAGKYDGLYAAVGLHPIHTARSFHDAQELGGGVAAKAFTSRGEIFNAAYYGKLAAHPKVLAIGECGLDFFRFNEDENHDAQIAQQEEALWEQIALAQTMKKPLMIHCRAAFPNLIKILRANAQGLMPGIIHFFSGTLADAKELLGLGFSFTFGGVITFARDYDKTLRMLPIDRILSETDAPYVSPMPYRGKRNEPAFIIETVKKLAELKGVSTEKMAEQIWQNAQRIFGI